MGEWWDVGTMEVGEVLERRLLDATKPSRTEIKALDDRGRITWLLHIKVCIQAR
jgi:hypothetical protein